MTSKSTLDCSFLDINQLIKCHVVETISGEKAIHLQTHHLWYDSNPLSFYVIDLGNQIMITDDGETIFNLSVNDVIRNKKSYSKIRDILNCTHSDIGLSELGEITGIANKDKFNILLADYISAMCGLMHHERETIGIPPQINDLVEEVEMYLKAWKPKAKLIRNPKIKGISDHEYKFDFEIENDLILTISPTPQSVGSAMRKIADVNSGIELKNRKIMVIVDNRGDDLFSEKATKEIKIISALAKALPLTNLIKAIQSNLSSH